MKIFTLSWVWDKSSDMCTMALSLGQLAEVCMRSIAVAGKLIAL